MAERKSAIVLFVDVHACLYFVVFIVFSNIVCLYASISMLYNPVHKVGNRVGL